MVLWDVAQTRRDQEQRMQNKTGFSGDLGEGTGLWELEESEGFVNFHVLSDAL